MRLFTNKKINNNGSTLVAVIIVISLVGLLAASLCAMTMVNAQMKRVDRQSRDTFYSAETALDEISLGLQNCLANSTKEAYSWLLANYLSSTDTEAKNATFKAMVVSKLESQIADGVDFTAGPTTEEINEAVINKLITFLSDTTSTKISSINGYSIASDKSYLVIKAIKVDYYNGEYSNSIITDIKITIPEPQFSIELPTAANLPFTTYALMAEHNILIDANKSLELNGNMYSGDGGLTVKSNGLIAAKSGYIITDGDILLSNTKTLSTSYLYNVDGSDRPVSVYVTKDSSSGSAVIYANNISVTGNNTGKSSVDLYVKKGRVYVADDLELNAASSFVAVDGSYYGFGSGSTEETSSSIVLNGKNSMLDFSNCQSLFVAGYAYIYAPNSDTTVSSTNEYKAIKTGESISIRGNQIAYLVPSACISVKHNPVTQAEKASGITFDWTTGGFDFTPYLVTGSEVIARNYRLLNSSGGYSSTVTYYYLNIKDGMEADFFEAYTNTFGTAQMTSIFTLDGLRTFVGTDEDGNPTNTTSVNTAGAAAVSYAYDGETILNGGLGGTSAAQLAEDFTYYTSVLMSKKTAEADSTIMGLLNDPASSVSTANSAVKNLFNYDNLDEVLTAYPSGVEITSGTNTFRIVNGDYTLSENFTGILLVTGNLTIADGYKTEGLVVAGIKADTTSAGNISIGSSVEAKANSEIVTTMLNYSSGMNITYNKDGEEISLPIADLFIDPRAGKTDVSEDEGSDLSTTLDLSTLVTYENWVKN